MENITVKEYFKNLPEKEIVYYYSNPGNAGDALIATGTFHLFDELGIEFVFINKNMGFDPRGKIVVYSGGGNFNHIYTEAREFMESVHKYAKRLILLPHTITNNEDLIGSFKSNVVLFARERNSFEHIKRHSKGCLTCLDHDMALHLNLEKIWHLSYPPIWGMIFIKLYKKIIRSGDKDKLPSILKMNSIFWFETFSLFNNKCANFFRTDVEASGSELPAHNADLSVIYEFGTDNREIIEYTVWILLKYLKKFKKIKTDRLHICIAASLLKLDVVFYSNSYFKCKAVYEYSLKKIFPNIHWEA